MRLLLIILFSSFAFATSYQGEIYTWGYGDLIKNVLDSIRMLVQDNGLATIFKAALAIAFLLFTFKKVTDGRSSPVFEFGKMMLLATAVWYLFLNAPNDTKHRYLIIDKVTGDTYAVEQVPTGIGEPLSLISNLEDKIIAALEKTFSLPDSLTYRNSGFGFPLRDQIALAQIITPDIYFQRTFTDFIQNCTLYEIEEGEKDITQIASANDLLAALDPNGDTRLTKVYSPANPDGEVKACKDAYQDIANYIKNTEINRQVNLVSALLQTSPTAFLDRTDAISQLFFNTARNARDYLQQNFVINITKKAFNSIATANGIDANQLAYANAITKQFSLNQFAQSGILAGQYLPIIKGVLLTIIVGISWIVALLAVMFMNFRYIQMYFTLLFWIFMWAPLLVIINYIGDIFLSKIFSQITSTTGQDLTLFTSSKVNSTAGNALAWLGYLVWLVPPLAFAIVKASERGFVSFASSIANTASQASSEGARAVTGLGQQTNPSIRVSDEVATDMAGAVKTEAIHITSGEQFKTSDIKGKDGSDTIQTTAQGSGTSASVTFDNSGNVVSSMVNAKNYAANVSQGLKAQYSNSLEEAKSQTESLSNQVSMDLQSGIKNAVSEKSTFSIDTSNSTNALFKQTVSSAISKSASEAFRNNRDYAKYADDIERLVADGGLSVSVAKLANGSFTYTFMGSNGEKYTITASASEAEEFNKRFSKNISADYAQSSAFREAFNKAIGADNSKYFSQSAKDAVAYQEAYQRMQSAKNVMQFLNEHGAQVSSNALSSLLKDKVEEIKSKHPGISNTEAVELVVSEIDDLAQRGELLKTLEDGGYLDNIKSQERAFEILKAQREDEINSKIEDGKEIQERVKDANSHTKEEVQQGQGLVNAQGKKVDEGAHKTFHQVGKYQDNINGSINAGANDVREKKAGVEGKVDSENQKGLMSRFLDNHSRELSYLALAGFAGLGGSILGKKGFEKLAKHFKNKINSSPKEALNELAEFEKVVKENGDVKGFLKQHDPELLKQLQKEGVQFNKDGSLKIKHTGINPNEVEEVLKNAGYDDKTIKSVKNELTKPEVAKKVNEKGVFETIKEKISSVKDVKPTTLLNSAKYAISAFIDGTAFNPTFTGGEYKEQAISYKGYEKDGDWFNNEVQLVFNGTGVYQDELNYKRDVKIETDVDYNEWNNYVNSNSQHMEEVFTSLSKRNTPLSDKEREKISNSSTPKELDKALTQIAFSSIKQNTPTKKVEGEITNQEKTSTASKNNISINDNLVKEAFSHSSTEIDKNRNNDKNDKEVNIPSQQIPQQTSMNSTPKVNESGINTFHQKMFNGAENWLGNQTNERLYGNKENLNEKIKEYNNNPDKFLHNPRGKKRPSSLIPKDAV